MFNKKTCTVAYNYIREGLSADVSQMSFVNTRLNPSDILTNYLPTVMNRYRKVWLVFYDIYPG